MSDYTRYRRTDPLRFGPTRQFSNLYRPYHTTNPGGRTATFTPPGGPAPGQSGAGFGAAGVDSAYRVVNRFMPQDRKDGGRYKRPNSFGPRSRRGMANGLQELMDRAITTYGEMASLMMEMLNGMYGYGGYLSDSGGEGASPLEIPDTYLCTSVPIDLKSNRPCEVWLELYPYTALADLSTADLILKAQHDPTQTLSKVAHFGRASKGTETVLHIDLLSAAKTPGGLFQAQVVDNKGQQRGTLTLGLG
jgi:hypothetical protein